jgi:outer membrane protein
MIACLLAKEGRSILEKPDPKCKLIPGKIPSFNLIKLFSGEIMMNPWVKCIAVLDRTSRKSARRRGNPSNGGRVRAARPIYAAVLIGLATLGGCTDFQRRPEIDPDAYAPPAMAHEWAPHPQRAASFDLADELGPIAQQPAAESGKKYSLPDLVELALSRNPETRRTWYEARGAAAEMGRAQAPYYPLLSVDSEDGYRRIADLVPKHWGIQKSWQSRNLLTVNYLLLDFGRRDAAARTAQEELLAANFLFNQKVQEVVFNVERAFYTLDAAKADVSSAQAIVTMAQADRAAAHKRLGVGLATKPQVLLSEQREAQAEYELQNARLAVSDAQARLAVAVGVEANATPDIQSLEGQPIPKAFARNVDELITLALHQRPDLAARVAALRASQAQIDAAQATLYPTLDASAYYGFHGFNYNLSNPPTLTYYSGVPEYAALVTLKWDLFTGFERLNSIRKAQADSEASRAELRVEELDLVGEVWSAYFTFTTALRKYDYAVALLKASQSAYDSNLRSYQHGLASILDLLSSERDLAGARYALIQSKAEVLISAASLSYAIGAVPDQARP